MAVQPYTKPPPQPPPQPPPAAAGGGCGGGDVHSGNGGVAAIAAEHCAVCRDEVAVFDNPAATSNATARCLQARTLIFEYEARMAGRVADETIFRDMLAMRRELVEAPLAAFGPARVPLVRWTLDMLRAHHAVRSGHRFDPAREIAEELASMRSLRDQLDANLLVLVPNGGPNPVLSPRIAELRMRLSSVYSELLKRQTTLLRENARDLATTVSTLAIADAVTKSASAFTTSSDARRIADTASFVRAVYETSGL